MDFIAQLLKEKEEHLKRINAINILLESYGQSTDSSTSVPDLLPISKSHKGKRFPKGGTYFEQIDFIFKEKNRFLHTLEIAEIISEKEGISDIKWLIRRVSASLSKIKKDQSLKGLTTYRFGKQTKDTAWGFEDWIDSNGEIIKQYLYIEKGNIK